MSWLEILLLVLLLLFALLLSGTARLFTAVLLYGGCGLILTLLWLMLGAPDLAMTEAAVGVGATVILYLLTLRRVGALRKRGRDESAAT